ncbi:MAG: aceE, partial [Conexibacter sp.]|nr:aceE [Conexibacter sp.]
MVNHQDIDPAETAEWVEALEAVIRNDGPERARELLEEVFADARLRGLHPSGDLSTPYVNTIPAAAEVTVPGDHDLEHRVRSLVRWNAIATVLSANKESSELGGHIASFQSAATLYEIGFNHFWHAPSEDHGG